MGMNKDGKLVPKVPDYEGLMRFFNQQHNFRSIDGTRILVYEKTHWTEKLNVYMEAFAEQWFNPTPSIAQRREFLGKLRVNNIVSSEWLALTTKQKINFSNGIYDIESRTLAPHSKDVGFFYVLPHAYNPTATCPRFDSFMEEITNNRKELEYVLLEYMAFALSGTVYNPAKVLLLVGDGANGKSTFLNILKNLVGKNAYSVEGMDELRDETHRYSIIDSLFNIAEETPKKALLEASWFKTIVGGGEITARLKFCNPVKFVNRCKLMFACNELPANNDATFGLWRRMLIVPFDARFTGKNDDNRLDDKLKLESEGIFNRILEAYKRFEENGFQFIESAIVDAVVEEYRVESNTILSWIADQVQFIPIKDKNEAVEMRRKNQWISNAKIYELYALWCKIGNVYPISRSKMMNMFGKHCMKIDMHELRGGKNCAQDTRVTFGIKIEGYSHEI
jgi:putative DNA primase/helicase